MNVAGDAERSLISPPRGFGGVRSERPASTDAGHKDEVVSAGRLRKPTMRSNAAPTYDYRKRKAAFASAPSASSAIVAETCLSGHGPTNSARQLQTSSAVPG